VDGVTVLAEVSPSAAVDASYPPADSTPRTAHIPRPLGERGAYHNVQIQEVA
jgi:hypothetical protein